MAAALSAARCGERVYLVESDRRLGGTVATALIHTLAGLYSQTGIWSIADWSAELVERLTLHASAVRRRWADCGCSVSVPIVIKASAADWIEWEPQITVLNNSRVSRLTAKDGRIIDLEVSTPDGQCRFAPKAIIDATGAAQVVR